MANRFYKMKIEVSTLSQACLTPETGEIGPVFLAVSPARFGRGFERRFPFLQDIILEYCRHSPVSSKSVSDAIFEK